MDLFGEPEPTAKIIDPPPLGTIPPEEPEGLQHPRLMNTCKGHEAIERQLLKLFQEGRMPHGLIFSGPKGIGKATFAYRLARFLLKQTAHDPNQNALFDAETTQAENMDVQSNDPVFRQVASGGHTDFMTVERAYDSAKDTYKDNVAVDDIRKINPFLRMTASRAGGWRVVIIDDADTMNRNAQNALLKILEEPPSNTAIILVCHRLGAMIPTIRSRTQTLSFQPMEASLFNTILEANGHALSTDEQDTLYHLSEGSFGKAIDYIEHGGLETLTTILSMFENYPSWPWPDIHILADQLARAGQVKAYKSFETLLPWIFSQMITSKARGQEITSQALKIQAIEVLHKQSSLETLLKICENLNNHFERVDRANLDKRQAVLGAFSIIAA